MAIETKDNIIRFAGDITVKEVVITSTVSGFSMDVSNLVIGINVYEDLFSPFVSGTLIINDSLDLMNNFPFIGEEMVYINMYTPTFENTGKSYDTIQQMFYIYKASNRQYRAERNVVYELHFISQEASADVNVRISKGFEGKISDIAKTLIGVEGLASDREGFIEDTKNSTKFVSNFWNPTKGLNYLCNQAVSEQDSPSYLFFENRWGFNFASLETLSTADTTQVFNYNSFVRDAEGHTSMRNIDRDYQRINDLEIPEVVDSMEKLTAGAFSSILITHDLVSKRYRSKTFDYLDNYTKEKHLNPYPITNKSISNALTSPRATIITNEIHYGVYNGYGDISNSRSLQARLYRINQIENYKVKITVPGRTDYTVGQVVELNIFQTEPLTVRDGLNDNRDGVFSGRYLIGAIHHSVDKERHECTMELIKDTLITDIAKFGEV